MASTRQLHGFGTIKDGVGSPDPTSNTASIWVPGSDDGLLEPVVIVGFSLKFPEEATSSEAFWEMLDEGRCAMSDFPKDRLDIEAFYHPDSNRNATFPVRGGHFLKEDLANFDAPFFSITPAEAACMDPQQRILLETSYHALENAGLPLKHCVGSKTSVYIGSFNVDYRDMLTGDPELEAQYASTGLASSMLANRVSWFFDFTGPSMQLDSACSSSLTALHLACQGLRNGEATMSLVGGSNLILSPNSTLVLSSLNFLSKDSRCFSFDERANGYARGEGFGVLAIKLLSKAIQDGDTIRAVIRATGLNQDGRTPGITQPNSKAQENLIRETYKQAGLDMGYTRFFEAHGTGTAVGDPLEADAIGRCFREYRDPGDPLFIGAVKSNIGHLEGASGVAGLIKAVMVLEKGIIPPNTGFERLNPHIDDNSGHLQFPTKSRPWPHQGLRRASVNSFGFGGSNAHVILDDAENYLKLCNLGLSQQRLEHHDLSADFNISSRIDGDSEKLCNGTHVKDPSYRITTPKILIWSAADEDGIARFSTIYNQHVEKKHTLDNAAYLENLAYTLAARRTAFLWRAYLVTDSLDDLRSANFALSKAVRSSDKQGLVFVFSGQGAQYPQMGRDLLYFPEFRRSLEESSSILRDLGYAWSVLDMLQTPECQTLMDDPQHSQPLCTALQIALVDLLKSFNIIPGAVVGHSSGEIAAAYCIGGLSRLSACRLAFHRGDLAANLAKSGSFQGAMLSVGLSESESRGYLDKLGQHYGATNIVLGCINSPTNVTMTGDRMQIEALESILRDDGIFVRRLHVNVAYHSRHMDEIASEYSSRVQHLEPGEARSNPISMLSTVCTRWVQIPDLCRSDYWVRNLVSPVRFSEAVAEMCTKSAKPKRKRLGQPVEHQISVTDLFEIGPHSTLKAPIREILNTVVGGSAIRYHSALIRTSSAATTMLETAGRLYCLGYPINIAAANNPLLRPVAMLTDLPEYPFDHSRTYWRENRISKGYRFPKHARLDLLGTPTPDWNPLNGQWRKILRLNEDPWIGDHQFNGTGIYPAAAMLVMAIEAAKQVAETDRLLVGFQLKDVMFLRAVKISQLPEGIEMNFILQPLADSASRTDLWFEFRVFVYEDKQWTLCCRGHVKVEYEAGHNDVEGGKEARERTLSCQRSVEDGYVACNQAMGTEALYDLLRRLGADYGPPFQVLENVSFNEVGAAVAELKTDQWTLRQDMKHAQAHVIHPTTLDGLFQLILPALTRGGQVLIPTMVPTRIDKLWIAKTGLSNTGHRFPAVVNSHFKGYREATSSVVAISADEKKPLIIIEGLQTSSVSGQASDADSKDLRHLCCHLDWKPDLDCLSSEQVLQYCKSFRPKEMGPELFYKDLTLAIFDFVARTLQTLAQRDLASLKPHILKYIDWMRLQHQRCYEGQLPIDHGDMNGILTDPSFREEVQKRLEKDSKEGKFFLEVGRVLPQVLQGEVAALDLLFQGHLATEYYHEVTSSPYGFSPLAAYVDALAHKNPAIKILEIGAGTGGATVPILQSLMAYGDKEYGFPRFSSYTFTDISSAFFEKAREMLHEFRDRMRFETLDIESNPIQQGFEGETYDLIIASNVLHATHDIRRTLENTRKLLKPGGKLVLFEVTEPHMMRTGFAFGLLEGWWLATNETRPWSPCLTEEEWRDALGQTGFSGLDMILHDHDDKRCHEGSIMVSKAVEPTSSKMPIPNIAIIVEDESEDQKGLAQQLQAILGTTAGVKCDSVSLQQAALHAEPNSIFYIFLLEIGEPFLNRLTEEAFSHLKTIIALNRGLLWVSQDLRSPQKRPEFDMVAGFSRALRSEYSQLRFTTLSLEGSQPSLEKSAETVFEVMKRTVAFPLGDYEPEFAERDGCLCVSRVIGAKDLNETIRTGSAPQQRSLRSLKSTPPLTLSIATPGMLDSLEFHEDMEPSTPLAFDEVEIEVKATGVNMRDCLMSLGQLSDFNLGSECAGVVRRAGQESEVKCGDRVSVCTTKGTFKSLVRCKESSVVKIPQNMTFVEAATLPTAFLTVYHALHDVGRIQSGESILIHAGAGGTGQIAIQIAQHVGANVYVTVGSQDKKQLLQDLYSIPADCIFYSRDDSFAHGIKRVTQGRGVDIVLNSLSGGGLVASWDCVAPFGRFLEIGKRDIYSHSSLPMFNFANNVTFAAIDLKGIIRERPSLLRALFQKMLSFWEQGKLHVAQPITRFNASQIPDAFRSLGSGKTMGKLVVEFNKDDIVPTVLDTKPRYSFDGNATYLIAGGLGGLGRSIAQWMVRRGVRYLILLSRSGAKSNQAQTLLQDLRSQGVAVEAPPCDITNSDVLRQTLEHCADSMPPIKGCIQGTMVLRDSIFEKMSYDDFVSSTKPKVAGSWNLHKLLPKGMDFFILLSSICGIFGATAQVNYATGNTYKDAIAHYRVSHGEKAISIDLGMMTAEGVLAENKGLLDLLKRAGYFMEIHQAELFALLDYYCNPALEIQTQMRCQAVVGIETPAVLRSLGVDEPSWMGRPLFRHFHQMTNKIEASLESSAATPDYRSLLQNAVSTTEAAIVVSQGLALKTAKILAIPIEDIDVHRPLHAHGVDSLVAVEIRSWLLKEMDADVAIFEILGNASISDASVTILKKSPYMKENDAE